MILETGKTCFATCTEEDTDVLTNVEKDKQNINLRFEGNIIVILSLRPLCKKNILYDALHSCFAYKSAATIKTKELENLIQFNSLYIFSPSRELCDVVEDKKPHLVIQYLLSKLK